MTSELKRYKDALCKILKDDDKACDYFRKAREDFKFTKDMVSFLGCMEDLEVSTFKYYGRKTLKSLKVKKK